MTTYALRAAAAKTGKFGTMSQKKGEVSEKKTKMSEIQIRTFETRWEGSQFFKNVSFISYFQTPSKRGGQHFSNKSQIQKSLKYPIGGGVGWGWGGQAHLGHCPKFSCFLIMTPPLKSFNNSLEDNTG